MSSYFERINICLSAAGVSRTFKQPVTTLVRAVSLVQTGISKLVGEIAIET